MDLPDPHEAMGHNQKAEAPPSDNLYVADLPANTTEESIVAMFGSGVVQCKVLPSKTPGEGTCVALVRFSSIKEAMLVRETLNGAIPPGQTRAVNIRFCGKPGGGSSYGKAASKGGEDRSSPYGGGGKGGSQPAPNDNLYITGLPPGIDKASLLGLFGQYGQVVQCKVLPSPDDSRPPHALVRYSSVDEAVNVKKSLTGYALEGVNEPLVVEFAHQKRAEAWGGDSGGGGSGGGGGGGKGSWGGGDNSWSSSGNSWSEGSWDSSNGGWNQSGGSKGWGRSQFTPPWGGMDRILSGFREASCLPGHALGNEDNCLFIGGLPKDCDDIHLYRLMAPFGAITPTGVKAMKFPDGTCKGFGFVNFVDPTAMQAAAMMLHGTQLPDGTSMQVVQKRPKQGAAPGALTPPPPAPPSKGDAGA